MKRKTLEDILKDQETMDVELLDEVTKLSEIIAQENTDTIKTHNGIAFGTAHRLAEKIFKHIQGKAEEIVENKMKEKFEEFSKQLIEESEQTIKAATQEVLSKVSEEIKEKAESVYLPKKGVDYFDGEQGEPGLAGETPDPEMVIEEVLKRIPLPKDGKTPKLGIDFFIPENKQTGVDIVKMINALPLKSEAQIDFSHIKNAPKKLGEKKRLLRGGGGSVVQAYDLTSLTDGSTKVFTIPSNSRVLAVFGTDFPINYRPTTDYTGSGTTTLTLTSAVSAPSSGATLVVLYVE